MGAWLERCRQAGAGDLRLTVVRAAPPAPVPPACQVESEADFLKRLSRIRAEAEARQAALALTGSEADELRAMGLM
jgi:hypothetical protein